MAERYTDWSHTRVVGDPSAAAPYITQARKLLGEVIEQAAFAGLQTHQLRRTLEDGTQLIAEKHGDVPRMTIIPAQAAAAGRKPPLSNFVVWARDRALPDGIDPEHPQQIVSVGETWRVYTFDEDTQGRRTGTYIAQFPEGIRDAGNVDWRGPRGVRVSWYGPSTRYWLDPHVQPRRQYGTFVFALGQVVLDVDDYMAESQENFAERWVLGAALASQQELLVIHAALVDGVTDETPAPLDTSEISTPWPAGPVSIAVCRYLLALDEHGFAKAIAGSRTVLWTGELAGALNPWFFNERADAAVCVGLPEAVLLRRHKGATTLDPDTIDGAPPSATNSVYTFARTQANAGAVSTATVGLVGTGAAVVAADFAGNELRQMTVRRRLAEDLDAQFVFECGEWQFTARAAAFELKQIGGQARPTYSGHLGALMFADLREQAYVTYRYDWYLVSGMPQLNTYREAVLVWHAGAVHADIEVVTGAGSAQDPLDTGFTRQLGWVVGDRPAPRYDTVYADIALSPLFAIYGHITQYQLEPRWDWTGAHGLYAFRAYPANHWWGAAKIRTSTVNQVARIGDASDADFESSRADFRGMFSALGCATEQGVTLLSCYGFELDTGRSIHFATGGALPSLTGVQDQQPRFHPIWLLGRPINETEAP